MDKNRKEFIENYINQLDRELDYYNNNASDENSIFDIITEISAVFSKEFPDLQKNLSFNNGTAVRDAKIVLGLLNKALIDDSVHEDIDSDKYEEIMNDLRLSFEGIRTTVNSYTKDGLINNYLNQLSRAIENQDIKNIKKLLNIVYDWYVKKISQINQNEWCFNKEEQKEAMNIVKNLITNFNNIPNDYVTQKNVNGLVKIRQSIVKNDVPIIFISHSKLSPLSRQFV